MHELPCTNAAAKQLSVKIKVNRDIPMISENAEIAEARQDAERLLMRCRELKTHVVGEHWRPAQR